MEIRYFDYLGGWGLQHGPWMKEKIKLYWQKQFLSIVSIFFSKSSIWKCCKLSLNWEYFLHVNRWRAKKKEKRGYPSTVQVLYFLYETKSFFFLIWRGFLKYIFFPIAPITPNSKILLLSKGFVLSHHFFLSWILPKA